MIDFHQDGPVVRASAVTKRYGDLLAVDAVDFEVLSGECAAFLGPNGAGKTTLMRMIFSAVLKTSGRLEVFGLEPMKERKRINAAIGVVFQENNLDIELNVINNLRIYSRYYGLSPRRAESRIAELLELMQLSEKKDNKVRELSGGMVRRLMIARALLNRPRLLILDEPTTGLDPQVRHAIWSVLRSLKRQGLTILLTTHYMEEAQQLADRVHIMDKGRVILWGQPNDLIEKHLEKYVLQASGLECRPEVLDGIRHESIGDADYFYCHSEAPLMQLNERLGIREVVLRYSSLEDVFFKFTGRALE